MTKRTQKTFYLSQRHIEKLGNLRVKTNEHVSDLVAKAIDNYQYKSDDEFINSRVNMVLSIVDNLDVDLQQQRVFINRLIGELLWRT